MSLFIESTSRKERREEILSRPAEPGTGASAPAPQVPAAAAPRMADGVGAGWRGVPGVRLEPAPSVRSEVAAYDDARLRKRRLAHVLRLVATIVLTPAALVLVFLFAYALTCIVNGAGPQELVGLMQELFARVGAFAGELMSMAG